MKHKRIFRRLVDSGHSAAKAGEILLDAHRGDEWARKWIGIIFRTRR